MLNVPYRVPSSWSSPTVDAETLDAEGNEVWGRKRMCVEQPFSDLQIRSYCMMDVDVRTEFGELLPRVAEAYENEDWFLLQRWSSMGSSLNIEDALKSELAAICVWFLFCRLPRDVKEDAARVLTVISFGTSEATNVSNQESVEILVLRVLNDVRGTHVVEVQRQICLAISFLVSSCLVRRFGAGIQDRLLQLIQDPGRSSKLTKPLISAIANIATVSEAMREKIVKSELVGSWLEKLMDTEHDISILKEACLAVASIAASACGKSHEAALWKHIKVKIMPAIVNKCCITYDRDLARAAALALSEIIDCASSPDRIEDVVSRGCLKALFDLCRFKDDAVMGCCLSGINIILRAGDEDDEGRRVGPKYNRYARLIDDFYPGWDRLLLDHFYYGYNNLIKAEEIVLKYCPSLLRDDHDSDLEAWSGSDDDQMSEDEADLEA